MIQMLAAPVQIKIFHNHYDKTGGVALPKGVPAVQGGYLVGWTSEILAIRALQDESSRDLVTDEELRNEPFPLVPLIVKGIDPSKFTAWPVMDFQCQASKDYECSITIQTMNSDW